MAEYAEPNSARARERNGRGNSVNQPDYDYIVEEMRAGCVIPFLGAGASVFHRSGNGKGEGEQDPLASPPTAKELADYFAEIGEFPPDAPREKRSNLPLVASYYGLVHRDEDALRRQMRQKFWPQFRPNELHTLLRDIAKEGNRLLIVTTNYDDMIEAAFREENVPFHLVVTNISAIEKAGTVQYRGPFEKHISYVSPRKPISLEEASIIYKMHGSINRDDRESDGYVIMEEHYVRFLGGFPAGQLYVPSALAALMKKKHFLFLGYSLQDWNLRVMLDTVSQLDSVSRRKKSWAIQADPDLVERNLWEKKSVDVYGADLRDFVRDLRAYYFDGVPRRT
jgi:hypothetical protein